MVILSLTNFFITTEVINNIVKLLFPSTEHIQLFPPKLGLNVPGVRQGVYVQFFLLQKEISTVQVSVGESGVWGITPSNEVFPLLVLYHLNVNAC